MTWEQEFVTDKEVAVLLGVCLRTVRNWRTTDMGPPWYRVGGNAVRYTKKDVVEWAETGKIRKKKKGVKREGLL